MEDSNVFANLMIIAQHLLNLKAWLGAIQANYELFVV